MPLDDDGERLLFGCAASTIRRNLDVVEPYTKEAMEANVRYWLLMFRPDTYSVVTEHGLVGVRAEHRRRFEQITEGDPFIAFISKRAVLDGSGKFVGQPFVANDPVFGQGSDYPHRCRVAFERTGAAAPVHQLLWGLDAWERLGHDLRTHPSNMLFCYGGFMDIPLTDYQRLLDVLGRKAMKG